MLVARMTRMTWRKKNDLDASRHHPRLIFVPMVASLVQAQTLHCFRIEKFRLAICEQHHQSRARNPEQSP
jgi:hypothetical protein